MNLRQFLLGMFGRARLNGELEQIDDAGFQDGHLIATTYAGGVKRGIESVLGQEQQRFLGYDGGEEPIDAEYEAVEEEPKRLTRTEIHKMNKPDLESACNDRGIETGKAKDMKEALLAQAD